jgi:hypothetical protein
MEDIYLILSVSFASVTLVLAMFTIVCGMCCLKNSKFCTRRRQDEDNLTHDNKTAI